MNGSSATNTTLDARASSQHANERGGSWLAGCVCADGVCECRRRERRVRSRWRVCGEFLFVSSCVCHCGRRGSYFNENKNKKKPKHKRSTVVIFLCLALDCIFLQHLSAIGVFRCQSTLDWGVSPIFWIASNEQIGCVARKRRNRTNKKRHDLCTFDISLGCLFVS